MSKFDDIGNVFRCYEQKTPIITFFVIFFNMLICSANSCLYIESSICPLFKNVYLCVSYLNHSKYNMAF